MRQSNKFSSLLSLAAYLLHLCAEGSASTFSSHVTVHTPARSFSYGIGDPPALKRYPQRAALRSFRRSSHAQPQAAGYPRVRPTVPFNDEDYSHNTLGVAPSGSWSYNSYKDVRIPLLPPSPYKVDSPDPESLWPEGLFLPPINAPRFRHALSRSGSTSNTPGSFGYNAQETEDPFDPYLLEGSEAIAAVAQAKLHGELYFHDIPHIQSLLANQELRTKNNLKPHRLGSIRHTWPYYRP